MFSNVQARFKLYERSKEERIERRTNLISYLENATKVCIPFHEEASKIESMVFAGGGVLGLSYAGALQVLEKCGLDYTNITKYAGTSAGSMMAAALAVGHDSYSVYRILRDTKWSKIMYFSKKQFAKGVFTFIPGVNFTGLNTGNKLERWFGGVLAEKTGDPEITFKQLKDRYGKTLIITACDLNMMQERKFMYLTDPNMPIKKAVRISASIPVVVQPHRYQAHRYCDGLVVNNFPVEELTDFGMGIFAGEAEWFIYQPTFLRNIVLFNESESNDTREENEGEVSIILKALSGVTSYENRVEVQDVSTILRQKHDNRKRLDTIRSIVAATLGSMTNRLLTQQLQLYQATSGHEPIPPRIIGLCTGPYSSGDFNLNNEEKFDLFCYGSISMHIEIQRYMMLTHNNGGVQQNKSWCAATEMLLDAIQMFGQPKLSDKKPRKPTGRNIETENPPGIELNRVLSSMSRTGSMGSLSSRD